jgi:tetratricopeptide (TPR) repeat protein
MMKAFVIRFWAPSILFGAMVVAASPAPSEAQASQAATQAAPATQSLLDKARAFEARGRMDLATQTWQQILLTDPNNTEALGGLARAAALNGNVALSQTYLERLRRINPNDPNIARVGVLHTTQTRPKPSAATVPGKTPQHALGGGIAAPRPGSPEMAAYAALNAKRIDEAETRFKAILAKQPANASALAGMGYVRMQQANFLGAISFLEQARQARPNDKGLAAALDSARFWFLMGEGQTALTVNDAATSEKRFRSALELRPDSPDALSSLGRTMLRAQHPRSAIPLFERAVAGQPAAVEGWRGLFLAHYQGGEVPLALATYQRMPEAVRSQLQGEPLFLQTLASAYAAAGRNGDAQKVLESAVNLPFSADAKATKASLQIQLAGVLFEEKQPEQAAVLYRQAIAGDRENVPAWRGLIELEHATGNDQEALATFDTMPAASQQAALRDPEFATTIASIYEVEKKLGLAQDLLQKAVTEQASAGQTPSPAMETTLADIYVKRGNPQLAYPIYKQVVSENPERADAWAGLLSTLHLTGHDGDAAALLPSISPAVRAQLETNASYLQTMAAVYESQGRSREAAQLLGREEQGYAAQRTVVPADVEIEDAQALYNGVDDAGLYRELMSIGGRTDLTNAQRQSVQTIWANWAVRRSNQAVAAGDTPRALAILNAASQSFPDNPAVQRELASGYAQAGQLQQAVLIYKAQDMSAVSAADYQAAVNAALATDDSKDAEVWLRYALAKYPADPQVLLLSAKFEQARGDTAQAMRYYRASLKAMPPPKLDAHPALPGASAPTAVPSVSPAQDLSTLLAPGIADVTTPSYGPTATPLPQFDGASAAVVTLAQAQPGAQSEPSLPAISASAAANPNAAGPPASSEVSPPSVPYIAPPRPIPSVENSRTGSAPVPVQLGNNTPPPVQQQTEKTDVLPTARYVPNSRKNPTLASDPNAAAAQAARVRRQQADEAAAKAGQSHPPSEDSVPSSAQVPQPSTPRSDQVTGVPDTGTQQYPQPRTPPAAPGTRSRTTRSTTAAVPPVEEVAPVPAPTEHVEPAPANPPPPLSTSNSHQPIETPLSPIAPPPTDAELAARNLPLPHGYYSAQAPIATPRQQAETAIASLEGSYSGWLGATGIGRYRSGMSGFDRLYDIESPVEASAVIGRVVRLTAIARPVFLNSGVLSPSSFASGYVPILGTLPVNSANAPAQQFSNGVGGELQLTTRDLGLAAGYTSSGFLVRNITGRAIWRPLGGHLLLFADRDSVKDTQLSYAGLRDPGVSASSGPVWGGVVATTGGMRLDFGSANGGKSSFYISGDGGVLSGRHVLDNSRFGGEAAATFRVANWPGYGSLTFGGSLAGMHYAHNETGMTYGQGGYFSPGYYYLASVPVTFKGAYRSNLHYSVSTAFGFRTDEQEQAPFYPLDTALQSTFVPCTSSQVPSYNCGQYPLTVSTGFNYAVDAQASYRFAEHWYGGGFLSANNISNFSDVSAGFFFRYVFRSQPSFEGRPTGLFPWHGFRPLQIP